MDFNRFMTSWGYSVSRKICDAVRLYGFNFEEAKREFDDVCLYVIEQEGGWEKVCERRLAEPPSLRTIWAMKAKRYLEQVKFPESEMAKGERDEREAVITEEVRS